MLKFLGVITIEAFAASALGMLVGCVAKDGDAASAIGPPIMTIFILFSGQRPGWKDLVRSSKDVLPLLTAAACVRDRLERSV